MANIVIIGADAQHKSSTSLRDILQAPPQSHTCTLIAESSNTSLLSFDLIITTRVNAGSSGYGNIVTAFNSGVPVICGMEQSASIGIGLTSGSVAGKIGLASSTNDGAQENSSVQIISNALSPLYKTGDDVKTHTAKDFYSYTSHSDLASGAIAIGAQPTNLTTRCLLAIASKGSNSLFNEPFPAACAIAGFIYLSTSYQEPSAGVLINTLVLRVLDDNLSAVISGYSLNESSEPVFSDVYVYKHEDGSLFKKTTTNADGSYSVSVGMDEYFVVCNNQDRDSNPQVLGYIKGVK